jgi:fatty acid desaturase
MPDPWFRKRSPEEGSGFSIGNREGLLVAIVFIGAVALGMAVPIALGAGAWIIYGVSVATLLVSLAILGLFIRKHNDS